MMTFILNMEKERIQLEDAGPLSMENFGILVVVEEVEVQVDDKLAKIKTICDIISPIYLMVCPNLCGIIFKASKVVGCELVRQIDLTFDFMQGSCNQFADPEPRVLLCFNYGTPQSCFTYVKSIYFRLYN